MPIPRTRCMEFSFRTKIGLEFAVIVFGVLSIKYSYLGVLIGGIGLVLLYYEIRDHGIESADFREKILQEALDTLGFVMDTNSARISCANWSSKTKESKQDLLGHKEYELWKEFFDSVEARNLHFQLHNLTPGPWNDFEAVNDRCVRSLLKIRDKISWVKESEEANKRIAAFSKKAKEEAGLSESLRSELW
jgi:hypothetical protein